ncbi:bifunctional adenosylcobinamide kinase/adenosylcobinamide-phosphate guanylyltransferase [Paenibacillus tarimensis]
MAVLITGGARSGKSAFAEQYAAHLSEHGFYIATLLPYDEEMRERIRLHREDRHATGFRWITVEAPLDLEFILCDLAKKDYDERPPVVLVDCLTLWLTNWMIRLSGQNDEWTKERESELCGIVDSLVQTAERYPLPLLFVTNEVGSGIVPEYPLGRRFRDAAGRLNQRMAAVSEKVFLVTAGIPVELKSIAFGRHQ